MCLGKCSLFCKCFSISAWHVHQANTNEAFLYTIMSCNKQHFPADLICIHQGIIAQHRLLLSSAVHASGEWVHELFKQYWFIDEHCMQNARWGFDRKRRVFGVRNVPGAVPWIFQLLHVSDASSIEQGKRLLICQTSEKEAASQVGLIYCLLVAMKCAF